MNRKLLALGAVLLAGLAAAQAGAARKAKKVQVLIFSGQNNHDWRHTTPHLREMLEKTGRFEVRVTDEPRGITADSLKYYDVIVDNYNGPPWGQATEEALTAFLHDHGKGFVVIHAANNCHRHWKEFERLIGGAWRRGAGHGSMHRFNVRITDKEHPISQGMHDFHHTLDEFYHRMTMFDTAHVIANAFSSKKYRGTDRVEPIAWVVQYGKGRVFQTVLGHDLRGMRGLGFIALVTRGTEWAATGKVTLPVPADLPPAKDGLPEIPQK